MSDTVTSDEPDFDRRRDRGRRLRRPVHAPPAARAGPRGPGASRPAAASAAPGTGTATRAPAATSRAWSTPTSSPSELQQEWEWTERYAAQPEILRLRRARRRPLRPAARHPVRHPGHLGRASTRPPGAGRWAPTPATRSRPSTCIMATGCLSSANTPDFPGLDSFAGETYHTGRWPARGRRLHRQARRASSAPARPPSSRSRSSPSRPRSSPSSSARPTFVVPARNGPLDPAEQRAVKADYAGFRERNSQMVTAFGSRTPGNDGSVLERQPRRTGRAVRGTLGARRAAASSARSTT